MEIWAKSNGETFKEHTEKVKKEIKSLIDKVISFYLPDEGLLKEIFIDRKKKDEFLKLLELVAAYHDIGKISPRFQKNIHNPDFPNEDVIEYPDIPHSFLSPAFFNKEKIKEFKYLAGFLECSWRELLKIMLSTIAFHHWRENYVEKFLNKWELVEESIEKLKSLENYQEFIVELEDIDYGIATDLGSHYSKLLIPPDNLAFLIKELEQDLSKKQKNFFILLKGFLHRADHFASSYLEKEIEIDPFRPSEVENKIKEEIKRRVKKKYGTSIEDKDIWQLEKIRGSENKNIFLKATTGVGKTEFALLWARGKKLIYVLPIRTAVNAMWKRLSNIFGEDKVGLLHSDALFYLEDIKDLSRDENISESFISYDLAKNLSYPVIVSTADQFFTAGLKYPGYEKIYSTLAYSYVVLDEIQLYDPRIAAIIIKTLEELTELGAKFCIMSATLPEFYKEKMKERKISFKETQYLPRDLRKHKIKLENGILLIKKEDKRVLNELNRDIEKKVNEFVKNGKKVLIILNTINAAKDVYEKFKNSFPNKEILLIHSQFTMQDRRQKEEIFENENKIFPDILIATQIAEVSLDIDYDVLFTELAPLDSIIQRMGRILRRYKENYKYNEDSPNIYICGNVEDNEVKNVSGVNTVYLEEVLISTYEILKNKNQKILEEKEKIDLIDEFYKNLRNKQKYFAEFEKMLDILDSLFSVESRKRAQDVFRNIINLSGIPENKIDDFLQEISPKVEQMSNLINEYSNFYKEWRNNWGKSDSDEKKELKKSLRVKMKEYKEEKRKINYDIFKSLSNSLVHIYPDKKIEKSDLRFEIEVLIENRCQENKPALRKWLFQTLDGIYLLKNVEYHKDKGAIIEENKKTEDEEKPGGGRKSDDIKSRPSEYDNSNLNQKEKDEKNFNTQNII